MGEKEKRWLVLQRSESWVPEAKGAHHGFAHCFFMRY